MKKIVLLLLLAVSGIFLLADCEELWLFIASKLIALPIFIFAFCRLNTKENLKLLEDVNQWIEARIR